MYDGHRRNGDVFYNKKAQYYGNCVCALAALRHRRYVDPDELIFLDPTDPMIPQLRSELRTYQSLTLTARFR